MSKKLILVIICLLALTPLLWFKGPLIIAGGDQSLFLNPQAGLKKAFLWDRFEYGGSLTTHAYVLFPFLSFFAFCSFIGISLILAQKIWFILLFLSLGLSMHYLYGSIFGKDDWIGRLIASIFFMFNYFSFMMNPSRSSDYYLACFGLCFVCGLFIRGINQPKIHNKYVCLIGLVFLFLSGINLALYCIIFIIPFTYLLFYFFVEKGPAKIKALLFSFKTLSVVVLVNLWALFATLLSFVQDNVSLGGDLAQRSWQTALDSTHIYQALRLLGKWNWPLTNFYKFHDNFLFIGLSYLIPLIAFSIIFFKIKNRKVFYFLFLALISLFLAKGANSPLGGLYNWLFFNFPGFAAFKEPYTKFMPLAVMSYAVLIGLVTSKIWKKFALRPFLIIGLACLLIVNVWHVFSNNYIKPGSHVKIPAYWQEANNWFNADKGDFKIFQLPEEKGYLSRYNWQYGFFGSRPTRYLIDKPILENRYWSGNYMSILTDLSYENLKNPLAGTLLGLMNVKYLQHRTDLDWQNQKLDSPEAVRKSLKYQKSVNLTQKFDKLEIYENKEYLPLFYLAKEIKRIKGTPVDYQSLKFLDQVQIPQEPLVIFEGQAGNKDLEDLVEGDNSFLFKRINPTKYKISLKNNTPVYLVFAESFHPSWKLSVQGKALGKHFIANGFANGFYIDKIGSYEASLEFGPQKYFYLAGAVSIFTFVFLVFYLFRFKLREKYVQG
jgi:hypothetical protein